MGIFRRWFSKSTQPSAKPSDELNWHDEKIYSTKQTQFQSVLGEPLPNMIAALIGWDLGGPVDLWIYPNFNSGTIFTTMQLAVPGNNSQLRNQLGMYELAAATRHQPDSHTEGEPPQDTSTQSPYANMMLEIRRLLTMGARYSQSCAFEPFDHAEVEPENIGEPNTCIIFDSLIGPDNGLKLLGEPYGVLLIVKVHKVELEYAQANGGPALIDKLKSAGAYPFSDLDRNPVV